MNNPICISTGSVHKLFKDKNRRIEVLRQFSPQGIEISFSCPRYLLDFELSKDNLEHLKTLKINSIHAPWKEIIYGNNKECKNVLKKISGIYKQINGKNIVFHKNEIEDYKIIKNQNFTASIENDDWRKPNNTFTDIKKVLYDNPEFKFTFDFAHAITTESDIPKYIDYFRDKLVEIHISLVIKELQLHTFLHKHDSKEIRELIQPLKRVSAPLILECTAENEGDIELIKKEIDYFKSL